MHARFITVEIWLLRIDPVSRILKLCHFSSLQVLYLQVSTLKIHVLRNERPRKIET